MSNIDKINELLKDEALVRELLKKEEPEDAQAFFEEHGVSLSIDDINKIGQSLKKVVGGEISSDTVNKMANGELSEDELEDVAGGIGPLAIAIIAGVCIGVTGGGVAGALDYFKIKW